MFNASDVVSRMITAGQAMVTAETAFIDSAVYAARAITAGTTVKDVAEAAKAAVKADPSLKPVLPYTVPASVGYHVRTGRVFMIDSDGPILPTDVNAWQVQAAVKACATADVDAIIGRSSTTAEAAERIIVRARTTAAAKRSAARAGKRSAEATGTEATEATEAAETVPAEAADVVAARAALVALTEMLTGTGEISAEAAVILAEIGALVAPFRAAEAAA